MYDEFDFSVFMFRQYCKPRNQFNFSLEIDLFFSILQSFCIYYSLINSQYTHKELWAYCTIYFQVVFRVYARSNSTPSHISSDIISSAMSIKMFVARAYNGADGDNVQFQVQTDTLY